MPPARSIRQRAVNNENDENSGTRRLTRAKAAALTGPDASAGGGMPKKVLTTKKSATNLSNINPAAGQRKRAALGDLSNVTKNELVESKEGKKALSGKPGLVSKATQNAGVQKPARTNSSRSILGAKDTNKRPATTELKRPASGSGVMVGASKKRNTGSTGSQRSIPEENADSENEPPQDKVVVTEVEKQVKVETKRKVVQEEIQQEVPVEKQAPAKHVHDLDAEDYDDPLMVAEYVGEIFDYLKVLEESTMPNPNYMNAQHHLEWHLRGVLVDWLVEVHSRFHLLPETMFLAINIIDRFLSARIVELEKLQLVGITAMFIASKYEEVLSPHVSNFKHVADDGFDEEEILKAERFVLQALNYDLSYPNPMNFLRRISKADNYDIQTRTIAKYLLEISLLDHRFMAYHPSHIAAASMYLARLILERGPWNSTLTRYSGYTEEKIQPVFQLMVSYLHKPVAHEAFFRKYASKKFLKASLLSREWAKNYHSLYLGSGAHPTATSSFRSLNPHNNKG